MPSFRARAVLLLPALLLGCSTPQGNQPASQSQATTTLQPSAIDGEYRGTSTRFEADRRDCPHPGLLDFLVQGGRFEYRWSPYIYVLAAIAPDGSVQGEQSGVTLTGRLDGSKLSGDVTNGSCGLHFTTHRIG